MKRREFIKSATAWSVGLAMPRLAGGQEITSAPTLFPTDQPGAEWLQFPAAGFSQPVCGVIYRLQNTVTNGMPLGGVDTGCFDLETSGMLGYNTIFNTVVPRRGPDNQPLLGLSIAGQTWVLCDPIQVKKGSGEYQYAELGHKFRLWTNKGHSQSDVPFTSPPDKLPLRGSCLRPRSSLLGPLPRRRLGISNGRTGQCWVARMVSLSAGRRRQFHAARGGFRNSFAQHDNPPPTRDHRLELPRTDR